MPAIWSSSERPISVKMVWVDGIRHAILSQDDPLLNFKGYRRRPQTSGIKEENYPLKFQPYKSMAQTDSSFDDSFVKFRLVVDKNSSDKVETNSRSLVRLQSAPVCARINQNPTDFHENESNVIQGFQRHNSYESNTSCKSIFEDNEKNLTYKFEDKYKFMEIPQLITLSERVLHWLNLSGKVEEFELENSKREIQNLEEEKLIAVNTKRKHLTIKKEGTCMKILIPTQYIMMGETNNKNINEICERRFCKKNALNMRETDRENQRRNISIDSGKSEEIFKTQCKGIDNEFENNPKLGSLWTPSRKPQLHIFMPSMKSTEI